MKESDVVFTMALMLGFFVVSVSVDLVMNLPMVLWVTIVKAMLFGVLMAAAHTMRVERRNRRKGDG